MTEMTDLDEVPIPALLRAARRPYRQAIIEGLAEAGFDDMPRNGSYVLGGIVNRGGSASRLVHELGVTKQAASQLVDTLVLRGYLERATDPADRRRIIIQVTERGRAAAAAVRDAVETVDAELATRLSTTEIAALRTGLSALADIAERHEAEHHTH